MGHKMYEKNKPKTRYVIDIYGSVYFLKKERNRELKRLKETLLRQENNTKSS